MQILIGIMLAAFLTSCSRPQVLEDKSDSVIETGIDIVYQFSSTDAVPAKQGCELSFKNLHDGSTSKIRLKPEEVSYVTTLAPGRYIVSRADCPYWRHWDFEQGAFPEVVVLPRKISMMGPFKMSVSAEPGTLHYGPASGEEAFEILKRAYSKLIADSRSRLVSAVTGTPVLPSMLQKPKKSVTWLVTRLEKQVQDSKDTSAPDFAACLSAEQKKNWLWLGEYKASSVFDGGKLLQLDIEQKANTFTAGFSDCVQEKLRSFRSPHHEKVRYDLTI